ncbi:MAG: hypothetical protein VYD64_06105, partial [Pseudomonadota bacterium]|nr:hypothetical protein [Pseudomonadota bacterium]
MQKVRFRLAKNTYPLFAGVAVFLAYPNIIAFQDVATLSPVPFAQRWLAHVPEPAGSLVLSAAVPSTLADGPDGVPDNVDRTTTASIATPEIRISTEPADGPRDQRINRAGKGDRVISATVKRPPAYFSAGSVLERHSVLEPRATDKDFELAFVQPRPPEEAFQVAAAFHPSVPDIPQIDPDLPVVVASLVTESAGNVLAYGPEEPRLARSPFAAVLNEERPISLI